MAIQRQSDKHTPRIDEELDLGEPGEKHRSQESRRPAGYRYTVPRLRRADPTSPGILRTRHGRPKLNPWAHPDSYPIRGIYDDRDRP